MTELGELCKALDADFEAALQHSRAMRIELEALVETGERALVGLKADAEAVLSTIEKWQQLPGTLARSDAVLAEIPERAQALSVELSTLMPLLLDVAATDVLVEQRSSLSSAREHVDRIGTDLVARLAEVRAGADAVVEQVEGSSSECAHKIGAVEEAIGPWVEQIQQTMGDMTSNIRDRLDAVVDEIDGAAAQLREGLTETFILSASSRIGGDAQRVHGAVDGLGQQAVERVGELRSNVGAVTGKLQTILDLIEPAKPILDQAAAVA